jgi:hypothetical protein
LTAPSFREIFIFDMRQNFTAKDAEAAKEFGKCTPRLISVMA